MMEDENFVKGGTYKPTDHADPELIAAIQKHVQMSAVGSLALLSVQGTPEVPANNIVVSELIHTAYGMFVTYEEENGRVVNPNVFVELVRQSVNLLEMRRKAEAEKEAQAEAANSIKQ